MSDATERFGKTVREIQKVDPQEQEAGLWEGTYSPRAMFGSWLAAGFVTALGLIVMILVSALRSNWPAWVAFVIVIALIWLVLVLVALYHKLANWYELTNQRLKHRDGILIRTMNRVELIDIDDVIYRQGPIQSLLRVGDITIKSSDVSHPVLVLKGIAEVRKIAEMIDDARRTERRRRGLHIESV